MPEPAVSVLDSHNRGVGIRMECSITTVSGVSTFAAAPRGQLVLS